MTIHNILEKYSELHQIKDSSIVIYLIALPALKSFDWAVPLWAAQNYRRLKLGKMNMTY